MTPPPPLDLVQLDRYLAGELSPSEEQDMRRMLAAYPELAALAERLRGPALTSGGRVSTRERGRALIEAKLGTASPWSENLEGHPVGARRRARKIARPAPSSVAFTQLRRGLAFAAAACLIVGIGATIAKLRGGATTASPPGHAYSTTAGQRASITLEDGTQVLLAPGSHLLVSGTFTHGPRDVRLDGEGFFTVVHDAARPFAVHAGNALVTDIGTRFDVRAYADDRAIRVAVAEGRVGMGRAGRGRSSTGPLPRPYNDNDKTLNAGDVGTLTDTVVAVTHGADVAALASWTTGALVFHDTPLRDALPDIARWYGVDLRLDDSALGGRSFTGSFRDESLDAVLRAIANAVDARYERRGDVVVFHRRGGGA